MAENLITVVFNVQYAGSPEITVINHSLPFVPRIGEHVSLDGDTSLRVQDVIHMVPPNKPPIVQVLLRG